MSAPNTFEKELFNTWDAVETDGMNTSLELEELGDLNIDPASITFDAELNMVNGHRDYLRYIGINFGDLHLFSDVYLLK